MPATTSNKSERLELAMAIKAITTKQEAFVKAVDTLEKYQQEILSNLDLEIETKKIELTDLDESYKQRERSGRVDIEQRLKEFGYDEAVKHLRERGEVAVKREDYEELQEELDALKEDEKVAIERIKAELSAAHKTALNSAVSHCQLTHKAETAELHAINSQQLKEVASMQRTIDNLREELSEQRKLTKDVANASRAAPITQNMAK